MLAYCDWHFEMFLSPLSLAFPSRSSSAGSTISLVEELCARHRLARTPLFDQSLQRRDYLLFASLAAVWVMANVLVHTPAPVDKSIAILPFENRGHDPQGADLAFGVVLDLQTQLEKLQDIKVIAQPSVATIAKDLSAAETAQKLGVAFIMKGTVERVMDRVRVSVTLVDAKRGEASYSGTWDRELDLANLFDIRDDLAAVIVDRFQAVMSPEEIERIQSRPTENFRRVPGTSFRQETHGESHVRIFG